LAQWQGLKHSFFRLLNVELSVFKPPRAVRKYQNENCCLRSPLRDFFQHYRLPEGDRYLQREFEKLTHDALQTNILPPTLTLEDMTHEIFNLIRSFSFVGEIGEDPEDYRISESTTMTSP